MHASAGVKIATLIEPRLPGAADFAVAVERIGVDSVWIPEVWGYDALTGLANRRHLDSELEIRLAEAERLGQSISCLMVDVDHFKRFNDQFGHDAGDAVLREVGKILQNATRESGVAFRYGGEEFLLLMPALGPEQAVQRAEKIQGRIRALRIEHGGRELGPITASFGLASAPDHCAFGKLVKTSDATLYRAKESGRNRIMIAETRRSNQKVA